MESRAHAHLATHQSSYLSPACDPVCDPVRSAARRAFASEARAALALDLFARVLVWAAQSSRPAA
jgi:hypothetical protein